MLLQFYWIIAFTQQLSVTKEPKVSFCNCWIKNREVLFYAEANIIFP